MKPNHEEGYNDGLNGRPNRQLSPNYCEGWEAGNVARMRISHAPDNRANTPPTVSQINPDFFPNAEECN